MNDLELTGRARTHVVALAAGVLLHRDALDPFRALCAAAAVDGLTVAPSSAFRDLPRQLAIWNRKFTGQQSLLGATGVRLDVTAMTDAERVDAILRWSALPATSRHHWGTDVDVYDAAASIGRVPRLVPAEFAPDGPFAQLNAWLDAHLHDFGFFRPYDVNRGGVAPEPWHISYGPVATAATASLQAEHVVDVLATVELAGWASVAARVPEILTRYTRNVAAFEP